MTIQHVDRNVGPGSYKAMGDTHLLVTKIFRTIQGEGPFAGRPAIFIRLAGCNRGHKLAMGCEFCDTAFYFDRGTPYSVDFLVNTVYGMVMHEGLFVITGGEPMMQDNVSKLCVALWKYGTNPVIQIESNGDRLARDFPSGPYLVVSPKTNTHAYRDLAPEVLARADCLKFVVSAEKDSPYYTVPEYAFKAQMPVYLSPLTVYVKPHDPVVGAVSAWDPKLVDHLATSLNYQHAVKLALQHGFKLSMQQHLFFNVE